MTDSRAANPRAPRKTIDLDVQRLADITARQGWKSNADMARATGVSERTVDRIVAGTSRPSVEFIAGLLLAIPELGFRRVFTPVTAPGSEQKEEE